MNNHRLVTVAAIAAAGVGMACAADAPRNIAFRRLVAQSSAADFTHVGHLVTDGVRSTAPVRKASVASQYPDLSPDGERPERAIDGSKGTKWLIFKDKCELTVTLPEPARAARYLVASANDVPARDPRRWRILGSVDGRDYVEIARTDGDVVFGGRYDAKTWPIAKPGAYRHYRLAVDASGGGLAQDGKTPTMQISEFDLLDESGKSIIRHVGENAFQSQWVSKGASGEWLVVDLGAPSRVDRVNVHWVKGGEAEKYSVELSADGKTWRRAESGKDVRFVRLACEQAKGDAFAVDEIEVWGANGLSYALPPQAPLGRALREPLRGGNWRLSPARDVAASGEEMTRGAFDDSKWLPAVVPGTVVTSYLRAGAIPDMNIADNQLMISEGFFLDDFWYRNTFEVPSSRKGGRVWLNFDAVNWKADVYFNGENVGSIEGAFLRKSFDVTRLVRFGSENRLAVRIHRNATPGNVTVQDMNSPGGNGGVLGRDNPTIHASIGWDWVPTVRGRNIGIYRDVSLSYSHDVTLSDGWVVTDLDVDKKDFSMAKATVRVRARNAADKPVKTTLAATIAPGGYSVRTDVELAAGETREVEVGTVEMKNPKLWWPVTYGDQPLYTASIAASADGKRSDVHAFKFGVREFTYSEGKPLKIYCNGVRIVCRGGNWGMDDANLAATPLDYDTKVRLHAEANLTMIRNWVGMTNSDDFYKACDKYGVLVWDDFWLANPSDGPDPADPKMFLANAADKILKNRHHASIPLYCARNEGNPPKTLADDLPRLCRELDGTRHYIPHSAGGTVSGFGPYSVRDPKWYFANAPETLHSERGQPNVPEIDTMRAMLGPDHLWPMDVVWGMHDYTRGGAQGCNGFTDYIRRSYAEPKNLDEFTRLAQAVEYENHKAMFESVYAKGGNGILMWMSQSAWPSMVWQTYDYWHDVNGGFYGAKVGNQPVNVILNQNARRFIAVNATGVPFSGKAKVEFFDIDGRRLEAKEEAVSLEADGRIDLFDLPAIEAKEGVLLIRATIGKAENFTWINAKKDRDYRALVPLLSGSAELSATKVVAGSSGAKGEVTVSNTSGRPQLLVSLKLVDAKGRRVLPVHWSDNFISLMPGESRRVSFEATCVDKALVPGLHVVQRVTKFRGPGDLPEWAFGPFVRPNGVNPVISPNKESVFDCPMRKRPIKWEESDTFNPAAAVKDGKIVVLYRAEDNTAQGIGSRTSRLGYAETTDGFTMKREAAPVLFPCEDGQKEFDWEGGCEDPRVAMTEDGLYVMTYTSWNRKLPRLCIATSRDLRHWKKHGPAFARLEGEKGLARGSKSAAILQRQDPNDPTRWVIAKVGGKYVMYWGEGSVNVATSENLVDWRHEGMVMAPRAGFFDSALTEVGPAALLTKKGIVVFYNGKNATDGRADQKYPKGVYCGGQALFDAANPKKFLDRLDVPYFKPEADFEKTGQYKDGTVFTEGLVFYRGKWHLYYGCADSFVGYAVWNPGTGK